MNTPLVRLYVDENGTHNLREDLSNSSNRYLCLTGIAMYLYEHYNLKQKLDEIKQKYFGSTDITLHRRELISGKEAYKYVYEGKGFVKLADTDKYFSSKEIKLKRKKDNIAGLQFVDLISHPARRYILSHNNFAPDIKSDSYEQRNVNILVKDKFGRRNNIIEGSGTVFFPK